MVVRSQEDMFAEMTGDATPRNTTPPQSPTRSVKSFPQTWSARVNRPGVPCSAKKCCHYYLRKRPDPAKEDERLFAPYGIITIPKWPVIKGNDAYQVMKDKAVQSDLRREQWRWLGYGAGVLALMCLTSLTSVASYAYWMQLSESGYVAESVQSSEIAAFHRPPDMQEVIDYVLQLAQEVKTMRDDLSQGKYSNVLLKPSQGILEELFGEQPDLACAGRLGSVLATPDTSTYAVPANVSVWGLFSFTMRVTHRPPHTTIQGLILEVGDCWAFNGARGRLVLVLHQPSAVSSVSLSHIRSDITSAPRHFQVLAHRGEEDLDNGLSLGQFEYSSVGPWRQTFTLQQQVVNEQFKIIEFFFLTNHGNPNYTCVYRVHVHGKVSSSING